MKPFTRDTARQFALGRKITCIDMDHLSMQVLGITDEGMFLGELEGGPFITYEWALEHCVFDDTGEPCGVSLSPPAA